MLKKRGTEILQILFRYWEANRQLTSVAQEARLFCNIIHERNLYLIFIDIRAYFYASSKV